jgi:hypothetical protein
LTGVWNRDDPDLKRSAWRIFGHFPKRQPFRIACSTFQSSPVYRIRFHDGNIRDSSNKGLVPQRLQKIAKFTSGFLFLADAQLFPSEHSQCTFVMKENQYGASALLVRLLALEGHDRP